jgi:hypothetical protein
MVSLLPATASVVAAYFLFRELSNPAIAFIAAFLVAVSQWHVTISRWGWDVALMSFLQLLSYWLLIRGAKSGRRADFVISGGLMGLCLYTYVAAWIALAIAVIFLSARAAWRRQNLRTRAGEFCLFAFPCLVVFAPLGAYYVRHPQDLTVRASEISLTKAVTEAQSFAPVWDNIAEHTLMFNYRGDSNPRHGFPDGPMLDFLTSIFFAFGLAYYAKHWSRLFQVFVLLWFVAGLQGGLLSDPAGSPHAYRTFMVAPVACFFAATAIYVFTSELWRSMAKTRYRDLTALILSVALFGCIAGENFWIYFVKRPRSPEVWQEEARDGGLPEKIASLRKEPALVIVDPLLLWKIVVANSWYLTYRPGKLFESPFISGHLLWSGPIHDDRPVTFIYSPVFLTMVRSLFPETRIEVATSPFGDPLYGSITMSAAHLRTRLEATDKSRLASAISKVAEFYKQQAGSDAEVGPRRQWLREAAKHGNSRAEGLNQGVP